MARVKCNACGGEYETVLSDGTLYFHACPPRIREFDAAGVELTREQAAAAREAKQRVDIVVEEREDGRDENVALDREGQRVGVKRKGAGVTLL